MYDLIIVGCGPAGMTAAIYALRAGKKVLILEKETIGGKIASAPLVENYPGLKSVKGTELANNLYEQVMSFGGKVEIEEVLEIIPGKIKRVITDMNEYETKAIILASGSGFRELGLPNEKDFIGNGISFCTVCDGAFYKDKVVAVVGGANSAVINAISLSEMCSKVYLIVRSSFLKGDKKRIDELSKIKNVEILYNSKVKFINGRDEVESIDVECSGTIKNIKVSGIFLAIGQIPTTNFIKEGIELTDQNYIKSDENCATSAAGIFVAGDVRDKKIRQLTTAVSDGTVAALNAIGYLNNLKSE